jgi:hypothetical protein
MKLARLLLWLNALVFVVYGIGFVLAPEPLAIFVTGSAPDSTSGLIDMRATYGGLCLAVGLVFALLARDEATVRTGLIAVAIVMGGMAGTRTLGFVLDGDPNTLMVLYLATEILVVVLALWALLALPADPASGR